MSDQPRIRSVEQPEPFQVTFDGPTGHYMLSFTPDHDEGHFDVVIGGIATRWHVAVCEKEGDGWSLGGLTRKTDIEWGETYWFEIHVGENTRAEYGVQGLVRTDFPVS